MRAIHSTSSGDSVRCGCAGLSDCNSSVLAVRRFNSFTITSPSRVLTGRAMALRQLDGLFESMRHSCADGFSDTLDELNANRKAAAHDLLQLLDTWATAHPLSSGDSPQLQADMKKVGDTMLNDWLKKSGPDGQSLVDTYRKM